MEEQRYVLLITPEGTMYPVHCWPGKTLELKTLQQLVDGPIETVPALPGVEWERDEDGMPLLLVNEEGKLRGLPRNALATEITMLLQDEIVGNAVLMAGKLDGLVGMTRERVESVLERWAQTDEEDVSLLNYRCCHNCGARMDGGADNG